MQTMSLVSSYIRLDVSAVMPVLCSRRRKWRLLKLHPPEHIIQSLTSGVMSTTGLSLSASEMQQVAYYVTGKMASDKTADLSDAFCVAELSG